MQTPTCCMQQILVSIEKIIQPSHSNLARMHLVKIVQMSTVNVMITSVLAASTEHLTMALSCLSHAVQHAPILSSKINKNATDKPHARKMLNNVLVITVMAIEETRHKLDQVTLVNHGQRETVILLMTVQVTDLKMVVTAETQTVSPPFGVLPLTLAKNGSVVMYYHVISARKMLNNVLVITVMAIEETRHKLDQVTLVNHGQRETVILLMTVQVTDLKMVVTAETQTVRQPFGVLPLTLANNGSVVMYYHVISEQ